MHRCQTCSRTDLPCISCNHYCPHTKLDSRGTLRIVDYRQTERQHRDDSGHPSDEARSRGAGTGRLIYTSAQCSQSAGGSFCRLGGRIQLYAHSAGSRLSQGPRACAECKPRGYLPDATSKALGHLSHLLVQFEQSARMQWMPHRRQFVLTHENKTRRRQHHHIHHHHLTNAEAKAAAAASAATSV